MATMRGGNKPTDVEVELMREARSKLAILCQGIAPKDIVAREAVGAVIKDLGLNAKVGDQRLGFRTPKMSIADKYAFNKSKMEESKKLLSASSTTYTPQPLLTNIGGMVDNRFPTNVVRMLSSDKSNHMAVTSSVLMVSIPPHLSAGSSAALQYQSTSNEVRPPIVSGVMPSSHMGRNPSSVALPRVENPQFKVTRGLDVAPKEYVVDPRFVRKKEKKVKGEISRPCKLVTKSKDPVNKEKNVEEVNISPVSFTLSALFSSLKTHTLGSQLHVHAQLFGFISDLYVSNTVIDMYVKCGLLSSARKVFDEMTHRDAVSWTELIVAYSKSGDMDSARELFDGLPGKDKVAWTSMVTGYAQNAMPKKALEFFRWLRKAGVETDEITLVGVISACAQLGVSGYANWIRGIAESSKFGSANNVLVGSALIDMYSKCGNVEEAYNVFKGMKERNVFSYSSMIAGFAAHGCARAAVKLFYEMKERTSMLGVYGKNGRYKEVIDLFGEMLEEGINPDGIAFLTVISACGHTGQVHAGVKYFESMTNDFKLNPSPEHYSCLVDLLCRDGDQIVVAGMQGPIVTSIRALLTPHPMKELRVKGSYIHHKEIKAAMGIKITAQGLEHAIAGASLYVVKPDDDLEHIKTTSLEDVESVLSRIDRSGEGVCVQASTLGSLEALLEFLKTPEVNIPVSAISIGPVHKKDVMKASVMLENKREYSTILAFDVKVTPEARELADELGVKIFIADIIYHLFDQFKAYMENNEAKKSVIIVSEFIVCSPSLSCVIRVNPWNIDDVCEAMNSAIRMVDAENGRTCGLASDFNWKNTDEPVLVVRPRIVQFKQWDPE